MLDRTSARRSPHTPNRSIATADHPRCSGDECRCDTNTAAHQLRVSDPLPHPSLAVVASTPPVCGQTHPKFASTHASLRSNPLPVYQPEWAARVDDAQGWLVEWNWRAHGYRVHSTLL